MSVHPLSKAALSTRTYQRGTWCAFDLETTNREYGNPMSPDNRIVMVAWQSGKADSAGPIHDFYGNIMECREFWDAIEAANYLIAHNAKFEAGWFLRLGYDPTDKLWYDTMLAEKVRLGNRFGLLNLGSVSQRYGFQGKESRVDAQIKAGVCPSEIDERYLRARCRRDVKTTSAVARKQMRILHRTRRLRVALTRCLLTPILADFERSGMCLDRDRVYEEYERHLVERNAMRAELDALTGGINMNSPDQKAHFFFGGCLTKVKTEEGDEGYPEVKHKFVPDDSFSLKFPEMRGPTGKVRRNKATDRWPDGRPKTDKNVVAWLETVAKTKEQKRFFELLGKYSKLQAAISKNLEFFKGVVDERPDGIFYGQFRQDTTATHRLSGRGIPQAFEQFDGDKSVQFQNMPRVFKRLFKTRSGEYFVVEWDGAQLEFRVAAFLGQDAQAMADIDNPDFDAHVTSAATMNERDYTELLTEYRGGDAAAKLMRQAAKSDTFKPLYGGTQGTPEQERWYAEFQRRYSDLSAVQRSWVDQVMSNNKGCLELPWGMRFYWDYYLHTRSGTPMSKRDHKSVVPAVFNYPVQSLATAEIIPIAIVYLYYRVKRRGLRVLWVNTVHDSVIAEVHKDDVAAYREEVKQAATADVYRYLQRVYGLAFNVPLGCETGWGTHWTEGDSEEYELRPEAVLAAL